MAGWGCSCAADAGVAGRSPADRRRHGARHRRGVGAGLAAACGFARLGRHRPRARPEHGTRAPRPWRRSPPRSRAPTRRPQACDLSNLAAVKSFAERFTARDSRLDVLVNNAGTMPRRAHALRRRARADVRHPRARAAGAHHAARADHCTRARRQGRSTSARAACTRQPLPAGDWESDADARTRPKKLYARTKREEVAITEPDGRAAARPRRGRPRDAPGWADTEGSRRCDADVPEASPGRSSAPPSEGADTIVWLGAAPEPLRADRAVLARPAAPPDPLPARPGPSRDCAGRPPGAVGATARPRSRDAGHRRL